MQPRIGIIGSGKVGGALGSWMASCGFSVAFSSRNFSHAEDAARKASNGAVALAINSIARESDIILLTVPFQEVFHALDSLENDCAGKIVVDVTNPVSRDRRSLVIGHLDSGAEQISKRLPSAHMIKAFNAVFAEIYASQNPHIGGRAISICYAGDDPNAKEHVRVIISKMGFDAIDAGPLQNARYLEPLSMLNIQLGRVLDYGTCIGFSLLR
jgi:hypothetical protein